MTRSTYYGGQGGGGGTVDAVARADIDKISAPSGAIIQDGSSTFAIRSLWSNNTGSNKTIPTTITEASMLALGLTKGAASTPNSSNTSTGTGAPSNATGPDFYYIQTDAATGTNNLWGPTIADGSYPAQADQSFASSASYTHAFSNADFIANAGGPEIGAFTLLATIHNLGTNFKHVTVFDNTNELVSADVVTINPATGDITLTAPSGYDFTGTLYIS